MDYTQQEPNSTPLDQSLWYHFMNKLCQKLWYHFINKLCYKFKLLSEDINNFSILYKWTISPMAIQWSIFLILNITLHKNATSTLNRLYWIILYSISNMHVAPPSCHPIQTQIELPLMALCQVIVVMFGFVQYFT